ncbi:MAG: hypothetical protein E7537_01135 [Ruminococcaceae bacterium]|nr:hypothetical protein [Oscillospiraceae bacterium]
MKRILSVVLVLALCLGFAGCKQDKGRELYNLNLEKYVDLGEYKGIKIDTKSEDFKTIEDMVKSNDVANYGLYVVNTKGKVKKGDTVNINYEGKKDGVAFEGGTAEGYDLTIGSNSFIEGFEEGLIGKKIGSTVDLNLTFPSDYQSAELAGADVVFTVKINYAKTTTAREAEDYYKDLGYQKVEDYYENVKNRAIEESLASAVSKASKIKDYPEADLEKLYKFYYDTTANNVKSQYQMTMEDYFAAIGQSEEDFKSTVTVSQIKPLMDQQMLWYLIFDKEKMTLTEEDTENKIKEILARSGDTSLTKADIIEQVGSYYIENIIISEKVFKILKDNAVIS